MIRRIWVPAARGRAGRGPVRVERQVGVGDVLVSEVRDVELQIRTGLGATGVVRSRLQLCGGDLRVGVVSGHPSVRGHREGGGRINRHGVGGLGEETGVRGEDQGLAAVGGGLDVRVDPGLALRFAGQLVPAGVPHHRRGRLGDQRAGGVRQQQMPGVRLGEGEPVELQGDPVRHRLVRRPVQQDVLREPLGERGDFECLSRAEVVRGGVTVHGGAGQLLRPAEPEGPAVFGDRGEGGVPAVGDSDVGGRGVGSEGGTCVGQ